MLASRPWVVSILSGLVLLAFAAGLGRDLLANSWMRAGVTLILAGALGNMVDRFRHGYVIDFIAVGIWPRFNLADTMITIGVVLMIALALLDASKAETCT
jgi:signal peptidase II